MFEDEEGPREPSPRQVAEWLIKAMLDKNSDLSRALAWQARAERHIRRHRIRVDFPSDARRLNDPDAVRVVMEPIPEETLITTQEFDAWGRCVHMTERWEPTKTATIEIAFL